MNINLENKAKYFILFSIIIFAMSVSEYAPNAYTVSCRYLTPVGHRHSTILLTSQVCNMTISTTWLSKSHVIVTKHCFNPPRTKQVFWFFRQNISNFHECISLLSFYFLLFLLSLFLIRNLVQVIDPHFLPYNVKRKTF